ncbi:MAG: tRNA (adenosine(37)-N6)-threonylcarbamoyltransferase complex ATPase subunit type 1 TsaE [Deltaproteobacteria bacterium]|nr:tRNA (adenosine(37)-N6)-threonylcarbamoyltransferase complex ATPase subunit type 1 TsaE [Deltaproteobacteria bacterium]
MKKRTVRTASPEATLDVGESLSCGLEAGSHVFTLTGDLGSGKTMLTKGIARGLAVADWYYVNSPTFTLVNEYPGRLPLFHFDLYRLAAADELLEIGFEEYLERPGVIVIEWPAKAAALLAGMMVTAVNLAIIGERERLITIRSGMSGKG